MTSTIELTDAEMADALLDAGAVLTAGSPPPGAQDTIDPMTARTYRHPALGDRRVVRLVAATIGPAEDLTMEFLGFGRDEPTPTVGLTRRQALGFPAWALVNDPANGHHALALVKDIERLARMAKSRIGPARDGFNELGERLARSVPHFLPTYYEQAARALLAADSATHAATMFGKARDAERVYALEIDEERQHAVFLEFALAGALTAKALSAHARDLAARSAPEAAFERFRRLCVERTLGGMPPYSAMHTDLRRLAKAAKLDQAETDEAVLRDLLDAPTIERAPEGFWTAYKTPLAKLAQSNPALRGRLLGMFPKNCKDDVWLEVLAESGALTALTEPAGTVAPEAESPDGPAGWLRRLSERRQSSYWRKVKRLPELLALVERMAPRLIADGQPVTLCEGWRSLDLDVADLCLALGVPVADPERDNAMGHLSEWLKDTTPGARDLVALAGDARFQPLLARRLEGILPAWHPQNDEQNLALVLAVPGLRTVAHAVLANIADAVPLQGLPSMGRELDRLALFASPAGFALNAEAVRRALSVDLGAVLGRTLRAGVLDEYGWPALEQAMVKLTGKNGDQVPSQTLQWPQVVLRQGYQVAVVDHDRIALEHLIRRPKNQTFYEWSLVVRWVGEQLLVSWDSGPERSGYWSGTANDVFTTPDSSFSAYVEVSGSLPLADGGRTFGGRPMYVGDRRESVVGRVISDGTGYWVYTTVDEEQSWYELDPATGTVGRRSLPAFFEDGIVDGEPLQLTASILRPAPAEMAASPLGYKDGLIGWRVRETADGGRVIEVVDGSRFAITGADLRRGRVSGQLVGAFRFPGSDTTFGAFHSTGWRSSGLTMVAADGFTIGAYNVGGKSAYAAGTPLVPVLGLWHHLRPRDLAGSAALRALDDERATALLRGAVAALAASVLSTVDNADDDFDNYYDDDDDAEFDGDMDAATSDDDDTPKREPVEAVRVVVAQTVPEITDGQLLAGVAGVAEAAAQHNIRVRSLLAVLDGSPVAVEQVASTSSPADALYGALSGYLPYCYGGGSVGLALIGTAGSALTGPLRRSVSLAGDDDWFDALAALPAAMYRAAAPSTTTEHREALLALLERAAESGLIADDSRLRRITLHTDASISHKVGAVIEVGSRRLLVLSVDSDEHQLQALDFAPDGVFGAVDGYRIVAERPLTDGSVTPSAALSLVEAVRAHGPFPWRTELPQRLAEAAGMSRADAAMVLAGIPDEAETFDPETIGLSATSASVARTTFGSLSRLARVSLLGSLLPADHAALWSSGPALEAATAWWIDRHGRRASVDEDLIVRTHQAHIGRPMSASELLHGIANPTTCRWLAGVAEGVDTDDVMLSMARTLAWLAYILPAGHPVRAALPEATERTRALLSRPDYTIPIGHIDGSKVKKLTTALGTQPKEEGDGTHIGPFVLPPSQYWREVKLRSALLSGPDDPALPAAIGLMDSPNSTTVAAVKTLLGQHIVSLVSTDPGPAGASPQDPSQSAPALVTEVAETLGLSADAATLYLQILALPDPTDRNVAAWTGWKPARLKATRAELAASSHIVEAKRERAGRSLFLPGGWLPLKSPHLPLERWKTGLLIGGEDGVSELGVVIPIAPLPKLFELAWARIREGDGPRFEELVTGRRR